MTVTLGDTLTLVGLLAIAKALGEIKRLLLERRVCTCQAIGAGGATVAPATPPGGKIPKVSQP